MMILRGQVLNIWQKPARTNDSGVVVDPAQNRVQIMETDENGKKDLTDLRLHNLEDWKGLDGKPIEVEVRIYNIPSDNGGAATVGLYVPKGVKPVEYKGK